jgi:beta-alanine degradation protein BauB
MKFQNVLLCLLIITLSTACKKDNTLPDPLEAGWNNEKVCEVIEDTKKLRILKCTFPPSVGHERHYHDPHFGYTMSGSKFRIMDTTGTREVDITTGSHFLNDKIDWHKVLNIGDSTTVFLIIEPKYDDKIIKAHIATIDIKTEEGNGSVFVISLPVV